MGCSQLPLLVQMTSLLGQTQMQHQKCAAVPGSPTLHHHCLVYVHDGMDMDWIPQSVMCLHLCIFDVSVNVQMFVGYPTCPQCIRLIHHPYTGQATFGGLQTWTSQRFLKGSVCQGQAFLKLVVLTALWNQSRFSDCCFVSLHAMSLYTGP